MRAAALLCLAPPFSRGLNASAFFVLPSYFTDASHFPNVRRNAGTVDLETAGHPPAKVCGPVFCSRPLHVLLQPCVVPNPSRFFFGSTFATRNDTAPNDSVLRANNWACPASICSRPAGPALADRSEAAPRDRPRPRSVGWSRDAEPAEPRSDRPPRSVGCSRGAPPRSVGCDRERGALLLLPVPRSDG